MSETNGRNMDEWVEATDEDGNVHYFEKVELFEIDNQEYALLIYQGGDDEDESDADADGEADTVEDDEDEDGFNEEYVIMRVIQDAEGPIYESIEDEEEFKKVVAYLEQQDYAFETADEDDDEGSEQA